MPQKAEHMGSDLYFRSLLERTKPEILEQKRGRFAIWPTSSMLDSLLRGRLHTKTRARLRTGRQKVAQTKIAHKCVKCSDVRIKTRYLLFRNCRRVSSVGSADAEIDPPLIHSDNIYHSANPEFKTVNLEPAQATRGCVLGLAEPLGSNREKTHLGEAEALLPRREARDRAQDRPQRNSSLCSSVAPCKTP